MKTQYIHFTPIPPQVPRQLAIEILQSHGEIITLNPLVLDYKPMKAPRDCPNDEYYSTWYEITERIQFVPGLKKIGSSKVTFRGCFHDMPWGVQTHMYIPMGVDLRNKWQIKGSQPGEAPEPRELGSGAPSSGLYLREEVEIKCNALAVSFVKKEMKAASQTMVERMIKKAELLDAGVLHAMFENGKLKTVNPADRTEAAPMSPNVMSPNMMSASPNMMNPMSPTTPGPWSRHPSQRMSTYTQDIQLANREGPNALGQIPHPEGKGIAIEMPGDFLYPTEQPKPNTRHTSIRQTSDRMSMVSGSDSQDNQTSRWSFVSDSQSGTGTSRPASYGTPPNQEAKQFTAELAGSGHKDVEAGKSTPPPQQGYGHQPYNPQNYARFAGNNYA